MELAQFRELEAFMQFSQDLDADTKRSIEAGARLTAVLRQKNNEPMPFEQQAVVIYAAVNGYLTQVPIARIGEFEQKLLAFLQAEAPEILKSIATSHELAAQTEAELKTQLGAFKETHPDLFQ